MDFSVAEDDSSDDSSSVIDAAALGLAGATDEPHRSPHTAEFEPHPENVAPGEAKPDRGNPLGDTGKDSSTMSLAFGDSILKWQQQKKRHKSPWIGIVGGDNLSGSTLSGSNATKPNGEVYSVSKKAVPNLVDCVALWSDEEQRYVLEILDVRSSPKLKR